MAVENQHKERASWTDPATTVWSTPVKKYDNPRGHYLSRAHAATKPLLVASPFVPKNLVAHLMPNKKDAAISVKYKPGDAITNMEGALHLFVTPFVPILMHGDYAWKAGHGIAGFGVDAKDNQRARSVILSGLIQPDFETREVMFDFARLAGHRIEGASLRPDFEVLDAKAKASKEAREEYDRSLKRHAIYHLTAKRHLPSAQEASKLHCLDIKGAIAAIEKIISDDKADLKARALEDYFLVIPGKPYPTYLSLEILLSTAAQQMLNEFRALERMIPSDQGYVYTWDPAAIFAQNLDATLLNRLTILGLRKAINACPPHKLRVFAFNDYADPKATQLVKLVFSYEHVTHRTPVTSKSQIFPAPSLKYDISGYSAAERSVLVVHNNSDAFGQNIQTEAAGGSMDGSFGQYSSAAASLRREQDWSKINVI